MPDCNLLRLYRIRADHLENFSLFTFKSVKQKFPPAYEEVKAMGNSSGFSMTSTHYFVVPFFYLERENERERVFFIAK